MLRTGSAPLLCALTLLLASACSDGAAGGDEETSTSESSSEGGGTDTTSGGDGDETSTSGGDGDGDGEADTGASADPCEDPFDEEGEICLEPTFELGSAGPANALFAGEIDGQPGVDVALASLAVAEVSFHFGDGNGAFLERVDQAIAPGIRDLEAAPFGDDELPDLAVVSLTAGAVGIANATDAGVFGPPGLLPAGEMARNLAVADLDGDSDLDLAVLGETNSELRIFRNEGGSLSADEPMATGQDPYEVDIGDLNGDERPDLVVVAREAGAVTVHLQNSDGSFASGVDYLVGAGPRSLDLADLNDDGVLDVVTANHDENQVGILYGDGTGGLSAPVGFTVGSQPISLRVGDLNDDGNPDAVVALLSGGAIGVLVGNDMGTFGELREFSFEGQAISIELADVDGDQRLDAVVANLNGPSRVYTHVMP